jgi:hypothetical protein
LTKIGVLVRSFVLGVTKGRGAEVTSAEEYLDLALQMRGRAKAIKGAPYLAAEWNRLANCYSALAKQSERDRWPEKNADGSNAA